jgi:hypothetical protein
MGMPFLDGGASRGSSSRKDWMLSPLAQLMGTHCKMPLDTNCVSDKEKSHDHQLFIPDQNPDPD